MQLSAVIKYSVKQKPRPSFSYVLGLFRCAKEGTSVLRAMKIARKAEADANKVLDVLWPRITLNN